MVGCRICSFDDPDIIDSIGIGNLSRRDVSREIPQQALVAPQDEGSGEEILFPSACAALYRRAMINEIGFFDGDFFAYAEDSDLGLRRKTSRLEGCCGCPGGCVSQVFPEQRELFISQGLPGGAESLLGCIEEFSSQNCNHAAFLHSTALL